jgi:hypothetical protein
VRGDHVDPNLDYDGNDEDPEYGFAWFAFLRGVYPPPAYPPA